MAQAEPQAETILEPDLAIVDPHHHLWDRTPPPGPPPPRYSFDNALRVPRYLLDELRTDLGAGHKVIATVFLECGSMYRPDGPSELKPVGETEFVDGVAEAAARAGPDVPKVAAGIVGHADLFGLGDRAAATLEAHLATSARFRGVRQTAPYDADPEIRGPRWRMQAEVYASETFRAGFARLAPLGLSFDAWLLEPQLGDVIDLARAFPTTRIVLDHVGTPLGIGVYWGKREERFPIWRESLRELARSENVAVKLGGLGMPLCGFESFLSEPPASSADLAQEWRPYIEACIEAFGVERCMFESNFPVDRGAADYVTLWNAFKRLAAGYSADEKAALFRGAATQVYRLEL